MEIPRAVVLFGFALSALLVDDVSAGDPEKSHSRLPALEQRASVVYQQPAAAAAPPSRAVVLDQFTFDNGSLPDAQGWVSEDFGVVQDTFFHVDDFAGLGPDYTPISGSQSLWCGTADELIVCDWLFAPGYGDYWYQLFESEAFATTGDVTLSFDMRYDCEAGFDSVTVQFKDKHGEWRDWASYTGTDTTTFNAILPEDTLDGSASFRIRFVSDEVGSDANDWLYGGTNGAVVIDNITISDQTGLVDSQDFESEAVGDRTTADGDWRAYAGPGFGDYAGLWDGSTVLQEDPLTSNSTHVWGFFTGSTNTYACGGHPEQLAVPLRVGGAERQSIRNRIYSPWIDLTQDIGGSPLGFVPERVVLDFDAYTDNPIDNAVFFRAEVRFLEDGCTTRWQHSVYVYYDPAKRWKPWRFTWPNSLPGATHVQVAITILEIQEFGSGACHSHAPLFDNVSVSVLENTFCYVISSADSGPGTLRQAILDANSNPDTNVIEFSFEGSLGKTIIPETPLPAITAPVIIDGYSQPQSSPNTSPPGAAGNAVLKVGLSGGHLGAGDYGLQLDADHCTVRGLAISGFGGSAIYCPNSDGHVIEGNYIGTDLTGTIDVGNGGIAAVYLSNSDSSLVGGTNPAARNVISGNDQTAVYIAGDGNIVQGNLLGIDATGAVAMGNGNHGVHIRGFGNTIGGTTAAARNVIADNAYSGIFIGGIELVAADNIIQGNYIGTDITGTVAIGNKYGCVIVSRSPGNLIGGSASGAGNVLAASRTIGSGVKIFDTTSTGNVIQGNFIGTDTSGTQPLGNSYQGVMIEESASNNTIGGTAAGEGNTIAFNGFYGVVVLDTCVGNAILSNSIFSNGQMGIALGYDGITMNDSADVDAGPNDLQNFPELTAATTGSIQIDGTFHSTPDTEFRLEFFSNTVCSFPGYGQGERFIGTTSVTTDGAGNAVFSADFSEPVSPGSFITATATDPNGSTSEFCECIVAGNTPEGSVVVVEPTDMTSGTAPVTLTFDSVSTAGITSLTINNSGPTVPGNFGAGDPTVYYHLVTTAVFTDSIEVCIEYDGPSLSDETQATLLHYDTTLAEPGWVNITADVDTVLNRVCGRVATLSPFVVGVGCTSVIYVDADAAGAADGSSWTDAFTDLQDALAAASPSLCGEQEIWVADGTYTPTDGTDRKATFQLQDSLAIYGGFNGTETLLSGRDWVENVTILSGDLGVLGDNSDNSYHVVTASGVDSSSVLDGFVIADGNADGGGEDNNGGGIYNSGGSPIVQNVWLYDDSGAMFGGGIYNSGGSPMIRNTITFEEIYNANGSNPTIAHTTVLDGKIINDDSSPLICNTILWRTEAGVVVTNTGASSPSFRNSLVKGSGGSSSWSAGFGTDLGNNIDADPMFMDANTGDLRLWSSSPAIDAGDSTFVPMGVTDIAGHPRNYGSEVDMGAYEYQGVPTAVDDDSANAIPKVTALRSIYPNPFNPTVTVQFDLDRRRNVQITIYDVGGRLVHRLLNEARDAGTHKVRWEGRDDAGNSVPTGVYFLQVRSEGWSAHRKIVLLK